MVCAADRGGLPVQSAHGLLLEGSSLRAQSGGNEIQRAPRIVRLVQYLHLGYGGSVQGRQLRALVSPAPIPAYRQARLVTSALQWNLCSEGNNSVVAIGISAAHVCASCTSVHPQCARIWHDRISGRR